MLQGLSFQRGLILAGILLITSLLSVSWAQRIAFDKRILRVDEGSTVTVLVELKEATDKEVTVAYESSADSANVWKDFKPVNGILTIPAGSLDASFELETFEDNKFESIEGLKINLSDPQNASLGSFKQVSIRIIDNDTEIPNLLSDFETNSSLQNTGVYSFSELSPSSELAFPNQLGYESVLKTFEANSLTQAFGQSQDWQAFEGISFWYYGQNTGDFVALDLLDNRGSTENANWPLVWADEFNEAKGTGSNEAYWNYDLGDGSEAGSAGWGNSERQLYTNLPENISHDGQGNLIIRALALNEEQRCYYGDCEYSSARIQSSNKLEFMYGRIEGRMKLPEGQGIWPAFWMLGNNFAEAGWPTAGEIDIMEFIGREPNTVHATVHGPGYSGANGAGKSLFLSEPASKDFHTFTLEWEPEILRWYFDGELFLTLIPDDVAGPWAYDHPFFLLLNLAVGGSWPGYPDETTVFPQEFVIDYIRVYGLAETNERHRSGFTDNFVGWKEIRLPFSSFARPETQAINAPNDGLSLSDIWAYRLHLPAKSYIDQIRLY